MNLARLLRGRGDLPRDTLGALVRFCSTCGCVDLAECAGGRILTCPCGAAAPRALWPTHRVRRDRERG